MYPPCVAIIEMRYQEFMKYTDVLMYDKCITV